MTPDPEPELAGHGRRDVPRAEVARAAAFVALWLGVTGGATLVALVTTGPFDPEAYRVPLTCAGVVLFATGILTGGRYAPGMLREELTRRAPGRGTAVVVASLGTVALSPLLAGALGRPAAPAVAVAAALSVGGAAAWRRATVSRAATPPRPAAPWWPASTAIATLLGLSATIAGPGLPDLYPLSRYPMYAEARDDELTVQRVVFEGVAEDGATRQLATPLARLTLLDLVADRDDERLQDLARGAAQEHAELAEVRVVLETLVLPAHPAPVAARTTDRAPVTAVRLR